MNKVPEQFESAKGFSSLIYQQIKEKYPKAFQCIIQTGHSLGAAHAELCTLLSLNRDYSERERAITFESPGTVELASGLIEKKIIPQDSIQQAAFIVTNYVGAALA